MAKAIMTTPPVVHRSGLLVHVAKLVADILGTLVDSPARVAEQVVPQAYPDGQQPPPSLLPQEYHPVAQ